MCSSVFNNFILFIIKFNNSLYISKNKENMSCTVLLTDIYTIEQAGSSSEMLDIYDDIQGTFYIH